jgi:hypothetical protein
MIPHTNMAEIVTVPDLADGGTSRKIRVPMNTPIVGWAKVATQES